MIMYLFRLLNKNPEMNQQHDKKLNTFAPVLFTDSDFLGAIYQFIK